MSALAIQEFIAQHYKHARNVTVSNIGRNWYAMLVQGLSKPERDELERQIAECFHCKATVEESSE